MHEPLAIPPLQGSPTFISSTLTQSFASVFRYHVNSLVHVLPGLESHFPLTILSALQGKPATFPRIPLSADGMAPMDVPRNSSAAATDSKVDRLIVSIKFLPSFGSLWQENTTMPIFSDFRRFWQQQHRHATHFLGWRGEGLSTVVRDIVTTVAEFIADHSFLCNDPNMRRERITYFYAKLSSPISPGRELKDRHLMIA